MPHLTPRQERFCAYFVACANASKAAREAGYAENSARRQGSRLMADKRIRDRIAEIQAQSFDALCGGMKIMFHKLDRIYRDACFRGHYASAARAVETQGRLYLSLVGAGRQNRTGLRRPPRSKA